VTPFRLTVLVQSPVVVSTNPLHLDALLLYVTTSLRQNSSLPIATSSTPRGGTFYRASAMILTAPIRSYEYSVYTRSVPPFPETVYSRRRLDIARGPAKSEMVVARHCMPGAVVFYGVGDIGAIREIMMYVTHISKLRRVGFGAVKGFRIDPIDEDFSVVANGRLVRTVPDDCPEVAAADPYSMVHTVATVRPPYWDRSKAVPAFVPKMPVTMPEVIPS
jgi:hypothetical protein